MRQTTKRILFLLVLILSAIDYSVAQPDEVALDSIQIVEQGQALIKSLDYINKTAAENIETTKKALAVFQKINNWEGIIDSYNYLSVFYYFEKDFNKSESNLLLAKELAKKKLGVESIQYRTTWINLITIKDFAGFKEEAIEEYEKIIIVEKKHGVLKTSEALIFHNLGTAYLAIGEFEEAIDALSNSIRIREKIDSDTDTNQADLGSVYADLADCYKRKKEYPKAKEIFLKSLNLLSSFDKKNEYVNQTRYNCYYKLAEIYLELGDSKLSLQYVNKAIEIKNKGSVFDDCYSYQILGKIKLSEGENKLALSYFDKAIQSATNEADGFSNFPQIATAYTQKGNALLHISQYDDAITAFQKGLQITALDFDENDVKINPSMDQIIQKLSSLDLVTGKARAFLAKYKNNNKEEDLYLASDHYLLATKMIDAIRQGYNTTASKHILAEKSNQIYEQAIETSDVLFQKTNDVKYLEQAFIFAESNKAITLLESMTKEMALNVSGIPDSLLGKERKLNIKLNFSEKLLAEAKAQKQNQEYVDRLEKERFDLKEKYKKLLREIEQSYPKYYQLKYAYETASVQKIQDELLDKEKALVEYFVGDQFIYSFLITKKDFKVEKIKNTPALTEMINQIKQSLSVSPESKTFTQDYQNFSKSAHGLYNLILESQLSKIDDKIDQLIIIPDGLLGFVPFDILLFKTPDLENPNYSPSHLSYLMNRFVVSYNYSSTLFFNTKKEEVESLNFIAFAPSFQQGKKITERTCSESDLYELKCAASEVNQINENFNGKVLEGAPSTKNYFLEQANNYNVIHLATHACVNEENALLNRIHFSDDYITMYDLLSLKLNADLVVLSACNTGTGEIVKGEGVMSLSRGFIQSGAEATLMSLWAVDDCATSDIMISFYENLNNGETKNVALKKAKENYINSASDKAKAHPYYWAAFAQFGDAEAMTKKKNITLYYFLGGILLVGIFFLLRKQRPQ